MFDPDDGMLDVSRYLSEVPLGFLPVPTIITEPATAIYYGWHLNFALKFLFSFYEDVVEELFP